MKLKYLIPSVMAALMMFVSCSDDFEPTYLGEVQLSSSYVAIPEGGGSTAVTVTATDNWTIDAEKIPAWLTVAPASGGAGETTITFSAEKALDGRTAELQLNCGGKTQLINVIQGLSTVSNATCAEVIAGPDSKTYRVTGTVTSIANTTYGNWYLQDATGEIYIYGTLDAKGQTKNFLSLGLEVGDEVTVEGPKTTYNGTVELVDVTVVKINKSLIKVEEIDPEDAVMPVEGGEFTVTLSNKGQGVYVTVPEDAASWLSISSISGNVVKFRVAANDGGDRSTNIVFRTFEGKKEYTCEQALSQKGAIVAATVAEFLAAPENSTQYRLTGVITSMYASDKQGKSFTIADYTGSVLIYRAEGFIESGAKVGDVVTVVGKRTSYNKTPQMGTTTFEELNYAVTEISIADFLTKEDDKNVYYRVTGTIKSLLDSNGKENDYGNMTITDNGTDLYVYGCYPGWGAKKVGDVDYRKGLVKNLGINEGDIITIIGVKSTYNGAAQVSNGIYFSHEKANEE